MEEVVIVQSGGLDTNILSDLFVRKGLDLTATRMPSQFLSDNTIAVI